MAKNSQAYQRGRADRTKSLFSSNPYSKGGFWSSASADERQKHESWREGFYDKDREMKK